ncbi:MAG: D-alanyl-D-alanine carboxypeptidase [Parcubacteria group bacterium]|nr:D-alanyl-D-alanine carboxypeptidase [Parcubacteria group bacterium]
MVSEIFSALVASGVITVASLTSTIDVSPIGIPPQKLYPKSFGPEITARAALVVDMETQEIMYGKNIDTKYPLASLTKLFTALIFYENTPSNEWETRVEYQKQDMAPESNLPLALGDRIRVADAWAGMLVKSANNAAKLLTRFLSECCQKDLIALMNERAVNFGISAPIFFDPAGLNPSNTASVRELFSMAGAIFANKTIKDALHYKKFDFTVLSKYGIKKKVSVKNTNRLVDDAFEKFPYAKTGYLEEGGYNFFGEGEYGNKKFLILLLGSRTEDDRFKDAKILLYWASQFVQKKS